jgi:hypothetical protein
MALPVGVTSALAHIDAPVSFGGTPAKVYLEVVPNIRLNHIATGTPLANFIDVRTPGIGDPATVTLPHTDQAGFQDESGLPVTNWSYAATIRYELDGQLIHVPTKYFQILTGQTDVDLALIPVGEPTEIILGNVAFVSSVNGRSGAVTLSSQDLGNPVEIGASVDLDTMTVTGDYIQSQNAEATLVLNYPQATAGKLRVDNNGTHVFHEYTTYKDGGNLIYTRARYLGVWSAWSQVASFPDPNADRVVFWDDSVGSFQPLQVTTPLTISGTNLNVLSATESLAGRVELATAAETTTGTDNTRAVHPAGLKTALDLKNNVVALGYRARLGADDPTLYPLGISNFLASSGDGWVWPDSASFKQLMTLRQTFGTGTGGTIQYASDYADNSKPIYYRVWDADDTAWGIWYRIATTAYVDAADALKADAAATTAALATKAPIASPTFTGTVGGVTKSMVGLGNVDNTSDANKPVSTAQQAALDLKQNLTRGIYAVTVNSSMAVTDDIILVNSTTAKTITLPDPATALLGHPYTVKNINTGTVTVQSAGTSKTLDGTATQTLAQWAKATYATNGTQWYSIA